MKKLQIFSELNKHTVERDFREFISANRITDFETQSFVCISPSNQVLYTVFLFYED